MGRYVRLGRVGGSIDVVHNSLVGSNVHMGQVLQAQLACDLHTFPIKGMGDVHDAAVIVVTLSVLQHRPVFLPDKVHGGWRCARCPAKQG